MSHNALPTRRSRLVPLAVFATVVALAASASAGAVASNEDQPQASSAAPATTTSKATVKSLTKQLKKLTKRIAALEQRTSPDSLPPRGPAKGDLTGNYPNPTIANNVVGPSKIPDQSLTGSEIATDTLFANDLGPDSVGASELKGLQVRVSGGSPVPAGATIGVWAYCMANEQVTGGGFAWAAPDTGTSIIGSTPDLGGSRWEVIGKATQANTLYAWALCLPV